MDKLDFAARFQAAYGIIPVLTSNERTIPGSQYLPIFGDVKTISATPSVFEDTKFIAGPDEELYFAGGPLTKSGDMGNVFAPPLLWSPVKRKKVIVTELDSGPLSDEEETVPGTEVAERYGDSEWDIAIDGLLVDMDQHQFPLAKLERIRKFFERPQAIEVVGQIWDVMGIRSIWFYEFSHRGVPGFQDTVSFTMLARSIRPVEFYLNGEES